MTGGERTGLYVVLDVFRKTREEELKIGTSRSGRGIRLRLHRNRLPPCIPRNLGDRALVAGKQPNLIRLEPDNLGGDKLIAIAANGNVAGRDPDVIEWRSLGPGPKQRRTIAEVAGTCSD